MRFKFLILLLSLLDSIQMKPMVIAHRGASGYLPEHTLSSKVMAYMMQADYIEQDVVLTKDNIPICLHDIYLDEVTDVAIKYPGRNLTNGRFYAIDFDLNEIKTLTVTERFNPANPSEIIFPERFPLMQGSFQINTLEEEIQLIHGMDRAFSSIYALDTTGLLAVNRVRPGIYVEIKRPDFHANRAKNNFSEIVLDILTKYNYTKYHDKCILQCFDPIELK